MSLNKIDEEALLASGRDQNESSEIKHTYTKKNIEIQMDQLLKQGNKEQALLDGSEIQAN